MKQKDLAKQIKYGKIYKYKRTDQKIYYVVPIQFLEKHSMVYIQQIDTGTDGYIALKGFMDGYKLVEDEY